MRVARWRKEITVACRGEKEVLSRTRGTAALTEAMPIATEELAEEQVTVRCHGLTANLRGACRTTRESETQVEVALGWDLLSAAAA